MTNKQGAGKDYFILYPFCIPVKGAESSVVYNLQFGQLKEIPNSMNDILELLKKATIKEVKKEIGKASVGTLNEYLRFLLNEGLGFYTNEPERFPRMAYAYQSPEFIKNAVIQYTFNQYPLKPVIAELDNLLCKFLELRIVTDTYSFDALVAAVDYTAGSTLRAIDLIVKNAPQISKEQYFSLYERNKKLKAIVVYNVEEDTTVWERGEKIDFCKEDFGVEAFNRHYPRDIFIVNPDYFMEAQQYNPYYNKKVTIDEHGNIKNCLMHPNSFGNVLRNSIEDTIGKPEFQRLWYAKHDLIEEVNMLATRYAIHVSNNLEQRADGFYTLIK